MLEVDVALVPGEHAEFTVTQVRVDGDGYGAPALERHVRAGDQGEEFTRVEELLRFARSPVRTLDAERRVVLAHAQLVEFGAARVGHDLGRDDPNVLRALPRELVRLHALVETT